MNSPRCPVCAEQLEDGCCSCCARWSKHDDDDFDADELGLDPEEEFD